MVVTTVVSSTTYSDQDAQDPMQYYVVTSIDQYGRESDQSDEVAANFDTATNCQPPTSTVMTVSFKGPVASDIQDGAVGVNFLNYQLAAVENITVKKTRLNISIDADGDGYWDDQLEGTGGFADIKNILIKDSSGRVIVGPLDGSACTTYLPGNAAGQRAALQCDFHDLFELSKGSINNFQVFADIAVTSEGGIHLTPGSKVSIGIANYVDPDHLGMDYLYFTDFNTPLVASNVIPAKDIWGSNKTLE